METAELLKQRSNGSARVVASRGELFNVFIDARTQPWVVNGRLVIDPVMEQYMDMQKIISENRYDGGVNQWSEGWFESMRDQLRDGYGNQLEVFSYFLPTWGLHYVLKPNAGTTAGDWAMIPGPSPYRWGGTWIGAWKNTKNPEAVKQMIEWITTNDNFLEQYVRATGDIVSNVNVMNRIASSFSEPFLGRQNHYAEFARIARNVNGKLVQATDQVINGIFGEAVTAFVEGRRTKAQALADFRSQVRSQLGIQ
jgi:ABC-type glycerol-3-phosphate transport system substrate-binding protein